MSDKLFTFFSKIHDNIEITRILEQFTISEIVLFLNQLSTERFLKIKWSSNVTLNLIKENLLKNYNSSMKIEFTEKGKKIHNDLKLMVKNHEHTLLNIV
jgi:Mn-dependent DtxR family transcriptional regulator